MRFAFPDGPLEPWTVPEIEALADWIHKQWKAGDRVLIRCQAGLNRSSLVTALVLMKEGMSADEAIALIRKERSVDCFSNLHFVEYLQNRGSNDN
jgi:protein-tyrosine phosphatase